MMKKTVFLFIFIGFISTISAQKFAKNRIIAKYKSTTTTNAKTSIDKILLKNNFIASKSLTAFQKNQKKSEETTNILLFTFKQDINILETINDLEKTGLFEYVEPDYIGFGGGKKGEEILEPNPTDALFSRQWGLVNDGTFSLSSATKGADVDMDLAWNITTGNPNIILAVLDSGVRKTHPEFSGRIWENANETSNGLDSDNNNFIDDLNGWDFVNNDNDPTDDHGHGTNVAGISVATGNNSIGYAGVDWKCKLMPLKILDDKNYGSYSWWISAINYAVNNGAKIINMSVGGNSFSKGMKDAVDNAHSNGVVIVACMMNFNNGSSYYPAAYANTIAVGSTDSNDERTNPFFWNSTSGSNYGVHIDVIAPGNYIYGLSYSSDTNYNGYWGGTSQATPLVAGICSLILDQNPNLTVEELRSILRDTAEDQIGNISEDTAGWDQYYGAGRVNAFNALQKVLNVNSFNVNETSFYPNPTSGKINISNAFNNNDFYVFDSLGKEVLKGKIKGSYLDLFSLKSGIYMLKIKNKTTYINRKVIKM